MKSPSKQSIRTEPHRIRCAWPVVAALLALALVLSSCGGSEGAALTDGGWIDGAPPAMDKAASGGAAASTMMEAEAGAVDDTATASDVPAESPKPVDANPLRAGDIDDNADFDGFLKYLERVKSNGVPFRELDPTGRVVITVTDKGNRPVAGALVTVSEGDRSVAKLRTTANGTTRFHPHAYGATEGPFTISISGSSAQAAPGSAVTLRADAAEQVQRVPLDIAFAIDATGSMGDEIDRMKSSIASVVDRIEALPGSPDVRLAMTVYRDEGDAFVTATHDFTSNIDEFRGALSGLQADGGGDTPEALDEAVDEVLAKPAWRPAGEATQLVFVIGDAGGHPERNVHRSYTESMKDATARGIKIIPIAASSTDDQAEVAFRQMAQFTGARFVFLAYGAAGAATGGSTDIGPTDYEELSLDDLIVKLVADELTARTGVEVPVPSTQPTTTRPPGQ